MSDATAADAPVAIAISEESGRRVELHDDRVTRAFRAFDDYEVHEIVPDGGDDETYWLTSSKNLYGERVIHQSRDCLSSRGPSLIREATANEIEAFRPCSVCAVDREHRGGSNETHECPFCGDEDIRQLPTHMRACDGDSEGVDRGEGVETDGGAPIVDDREESTNCSHKFDHDYRERDRDAVWIRFECGDCGERRKKFRSMDAAFAFLLDGGDEDRGDDGIVTDGGVNTYLDGCEEWYLIGVVVWCRSCWLGSTAGRARTDSSVTAVSHRIPARRSGAIHWSGQRARWRCAMPECDLCGEPVADDWLLCARCRRVRQRAPPREGGGLDE